MQNRSGLIVRAELTRADGHAERRGAITMLHRHLPGSPRRLTLAADRGYDRSQRCRRKIGQPFGQDRTVGLCIAALSAPALL